MDLWLFRLINGLAGHTSVLDQIMMAFVSDYVGPTLQALGLLGLWFEGSHAPERQSNQRTVLRALVALILSTALVAVCNLLYFRDRPFRYHDVNLLFYYPSDSSFPSNSAAVVFAVAFAIWWGNRRWGAPLIGLAAVFAFSRVYCGVHYPGDILGALVIGLVSAWLLQRVASRLNIVFDRIIGLVRRIHLA